MMQVSALDKETSTILNGWFLTTMAPSLFIGKKGSTLSGSTQDDQVAVLANFTALVVGPSLLCSNFYLLCF